MLTINNEIENVVIQIKITITNVCRITIINTTYNMYYTHPQSCFNHLIFLCQDESAVGCQSTLTLLLRRVSHHGLRIPIQV